MKKKLWGVLIALTVFLFIAGCGNQKKNSTKTTKPDERIQAVNYQSLTKEEKKNIEFKFKTAEDSYDYAIDMTIKNRSDKDVRFHLTDFMMLDRNNPDFQINSSLKRVITIKSGDETTVDKLFEHIPQTILEGTGSYYYLNNNYRLGYLRDTVGVVEQASSSATPARTASSSASVSVVPRTLQKGNTANGVTAKASTLQQSSTNQNIINDSEQAVALYKHAMALAGRRDIVAVPVQGGFSVYSTEDPTIGNNFVSYDGSIESKGIVTPYSQASKQTYNDQPGDEQFDPSKY
ncbi:hypothetical protein [Companilactobacillus insicii]|uniref:hypothetical protein n=1 Tax=Companilactobacillus insicii TaxID=1732567 RepID=UPI000F7B9D82|nr:hypothetical protein [Companilactobacillus insicii]